MKKQKSIKINMVLNAIKGLMSVLFPLISFPYVSRILGVDALGQYNFANSIIGYFVLLSGLGINTYAVRECSRYRDDKDKLNKTVNEIFTINVLSTIFSYLIFFVSLILVSKFHDYKILLLIFSLQIIFKTIGIEWIYSIYEDYLYITVRSIIVQIFSIICLFIFVKSPNDLNIYVLITVLANVGSNVFNYFHSKKYCNVKLTKKLNLKNHLKPILTLFALNLTVSIYVNSDITILGFLDSDYSVGIYSVSVKIYTIVKNLLMSILAVSIPRLAFYLGKDNLEEFKNIASDIYKTLFTIVLPSMVGIIFLSNEIILLISGQNYISANISLVLLGISLIATLGSYFWSQCILIPFRKDNVVLKATIISALVNIILNIILIPFWKQNAAALTTIIAELIVFVWCKIESRKLIKLDKMFLITLKVLIGCIGIICSLIIFKQFINNLYIYMLVSIIFSIIIYGVIELLLKNEIIYSLFQKIKAKFMFLSKK